MDEEEAMRMEYYLEIGAISVEGVDESGELVFAITDLAKDVAPELWQAHKDHVDKSMLDLYEKGLVEIEYDENLEVTLKISPEGQRLAKEYGLIPPAGWEEE